MPAHIGFALLPNFESGELFRLQQMKIETVVEVVAVNR